MTNLISFPEFIEVGGDRHDLNQIARVKPLYGAQGNHTRVYYVNDTYREFPDPSGVLFDTLVCNGVSF